MDWIKGLQKSIDYMEEHITEPVDYGRIAREMNVSEFYFIRIFTMLCGITPGEYIRSRRLSLAGSELLSGDSKVIDIALKYGYDTPEGFTRAFTRFHNATPSAVRRQHLPIKSFSPLRISITVKGGKSMDYRIVEKGAFSVLERVETHRVITEENKDEIADFWDRAKSDGTVDTLVNALADGENNLIGVCYGDTADGGTFDYSIAAVCDEGTVAPTGYRVSRIPARTWAVFEAVGAMPDAIQQTWHRIITEFFPTSDYEPTYEMDIEDYPDGDTEADDYRCHIWVAVKKKAV